MFSVSLVFTFFSVFSVSFVLRDSLVFSVYSVFRLYLFEFIVVFKIYLLLVFLIRSLLCREDRGRNLGEGSWREREREMKDAEESEIEMEKEEGRKGRMEERKTGKK